MLLFTATSASTEGATTPQEGAQKGQGAQTSLPVLAQLADSGVTPYFLATADLFGVSDGQRSRGGAATLVKAGADLNLATLVGWQGASLRMGVFLIGGKAPGERESGGLGPLSNIQAAPTARLADVYLKQSFLEDRLTIKIGQMSVDDSFGFAGPAEVLVNPTFGWAAINGYNLPGGGPAYPAPAPGVEIAVKPAAGWTVQVGAYSGSPWHSGHWNRRGAALNFRHGSFVMAEVGHEHSIAGLPGAIKLGAWRSAPSSRDMRLLGWLEEHAVRRTGNAIYAVVEQTVWRGANDAEARVFGRIWRANASRSPSIDLYADGGISLKGVIAGRSDDVIGLGLAYARISRRGAVELAPDHHVALRGSSLIGEASWRLQLHDGVTAQPFVQYFVRPGGGMQDEHRPGRRLRDVAVFGLRAQAGF